MRTITFFTKPECSLCDAALYVLDRVRRDTPFVLRKVDISAPGEERWFAAYCHDIPVVHLDGKEVFRHHVHERRLRELLDPKRDAPGDPSLRSG